MGHPKTSLSFITASIFLKVIIAININPIFNSDFQGALLLALWYPARDMSATYNELLMGISISCFFLSLVMMCLYYSYFHPNRLSHAESEGKWLIQRIQKSSKSKSNFIWSRKKGIQYLNSSHQKRYIRAREILEWNTFNWKWKIKISAKI